MTEENGYRPNVSGIVAGLVMIGIGVLIAFGLLSGSSDRSGPPSGQWLIFLAPALIVGGGVTFVRAFLPGTKTFSSRSVLITGLIMLAIGVFPWFYTPLLTGDRAGGESAGMLGTLICLLVGLPGLILTIIGGLLRLAGSE